MREQFNSHIFLLLLFLIIRTDAYMPQCLPQCQCKSTKLLLCSKRAYQTIPIPITFENIKLVSQDFSQSSLTSSNFTVKPGIKLKSVKINYSNKLVLHSNTFHRLSFLRVIDLSDTIELHLKSRVFEDLILKELIINSVSSLSIDDGAFLGLKVTKLSMKFCKIKELSVELFRPIRNSLRYLNLEHNLIITISSKFEPIFSSLQNLKLNGNRLFCNCSLKWLSKLLKRQSSLCTEPLRCTMPSKLRMQPLHTISDNITGCDPPTISRIDINFLSRSQARISCFSPSSKDGLVTWASSHSRHKFQNPLLVSRNNQLSPPTYVCEARNPNGRTTLQINFVWFQSTTTTPLLITTPKTISIDADTNPTNTGSYFQKEVFTMFDMIFAIIGTLLITVGLFFVLCCLLTLKQRNKLAGKRKAALKTYLSYDKGIYSETTHVVNGGGIYCDTEIDRTMLYPPPPPSTNILPPLPPTYTLQY